MRIETDRYLISTDPHNIIVQLKAPRQDSSLLKDKSLIGEIILGDKRFYPSLAQAYAGISKELMLTDDEITSLSDVKQLLRELKREAGSIKMEVKHG